MPDPLLASLRAPCPLPAGSNVFTYARDSGGDTQERSVDEQIRLYNAWAQEHQLVVLQHFCDRARPGSSMVGRDGLEQLLAEARGSTRRADGIIFWSLDRLSRDQIECQYLKADLRLRGYQLVFLSNDIPDAGDFSHVIEAFYAWKAEEDLKTISRNSKRGLADLVTRKKKDGSYEGFMPGIPPRGFVGEPVEIGIKRTGKPRIVQRWVPDSKWWRKCRQAWQLRAGGMSTPDINRKLHLFKNVTCFSTFFRNPIYRGELRYGGMLLKGFVPRLVDDDTWEKVQRINAQRKKRIQYDPRRIASAYVLSGLVFCSACGAAMRGQIDSRRTVTPRRSYVCPNRAKGTCSAKRIPAPAIEQAVIDTVCKRILIPKHLRILADEMIATRGRIVSEADETIEELKARLKTVDKAIANIVRSAEQAPLSEALATSLTEREADQRVLRLQLETLQLTRSTAAPPPQPTDEDLELLAARIRTALPKGGAESRNVLSALIQRIDADRQSAVIHYTFPIEKAANSGGSSFRTHPTVCAPDGVRSDRRISITWAVRPETDPVRNAEIRRRHGQGESYGELAQAFGISPQRVEQIFHNTITP